jgi:hypothetical protein
MRLCGVGGVEAVDVVVKAALASRRVVVGARAAGSSDRLAVL